MSALVFAGCQRESESSILLLAPDYDARELSHRLGPYAAWSDLDLTDLAPQDGGGVESAQGWTGQTRLAVLAPGSGAVDPDMLQRAVPQARVFCLEGTLSAAAGTWGARCVPGTVVSIGARTYTRAQRDLMRDRQRLLPCHELDLATAVRTAVDESESFPLWIRVGLDVLEGYGQAVASGGARFKELQSALVLIPGDRVAGFEIVGFPAPEERNLALALTGVELLRDNILSWWS